MYGKEASNRKQEIDRQHHTIPNKRTKDQKTSTVEMCITCYSVMEKSIRQQVMHIPTVPTTTESLFISTQIISFMAYSNLRQ